MATLAMATASPAAIVSVDWSSAFKTVTTAATMEITIMPFLARVPQGGSFAGYARALSALPATQVRFAPWMAYPRVSVLELDEPDCSSTGPGSSWNSTVLDAVLADFMAAVCGPDAAKGGCRAGRSVAMQLSTMPAWL